VDLCEKKTKADEKELGGEEGRTWIWTALDAATRLLVSFCVGDRTLEDARSSLKDLASRMKGKPLFVSDELAHYETVLLELFHETVESPRTGKPGRPRAPEVVPQTDLDYAVVHKTRENGRVTKVERRIVFGDERSVGKRLEASPSETINTAYIERSNLDWRLWDAHLARKSVTFARALRWLKAKFAICATFYDFIRPHGTLSRHGPPTTPAMRAGITDHVWSILELIGRPMLLSME